MNVWLARIPQNGPWLVSLALGALIAVQLGFVAKSLWGAGPVKTVQPVATRSGQPASAARFDVGRVVAAHLFGNAAADPAVQDPNNAPQSTANLTLAGTIATQDPKHGVAIITDGGPSKVYSVGDNVNGASLHSVYLDHVILDRGGVLETLILPRVLAASTQVRPTVSRRQVGMQGSTAANLDNVRRMVQQDPGLLNEVMRTVASYDNQAGKLRGFRIYPGRNRSAFNGLGLRPGDLVTAINGTTLDDPQRGQEIFNAIQSSNSASVTIERAGKTIDVSLNLAQLATDASRDLSAAPPGMPGGTPIMPGGGLPNGEGGVPQPAPEPGPGQP
jgi:general secretion pathway protein C